MKQGYVAKPKTIKNVDDLNEFYLMKNKYWDEYDLPKYIASNNEHDIFMVIGYSHSQMKWFFDNYEMLKRFGVGNTIDEAMQNLLSKL